MLIAGAASTTGASHLVLRLSELGLIDGFVSAQAVREAERNLERKVPAAIPAFRALLAAACRPVGDPSADRIAALRDQADPKDVPILAAALDHGCHWLLTFDTKDFRPASNRILVAQPGAFIEALRRMLEALGEQR